MASLKVLGSITMLLTPRKSSQAADKAPLLQNQSDRSRVKFANPSGLMFVGGVSSHYDLSLSDEIDFSDVIGHEELTYIVRQFNESLQSYWPCTAVYACGCVMAPCTLGFSLFAPNYCITHAEASGTRCLEQISLKGCYYHKDIKFHLKKTWGCSSYLEVSFPSSLLLSHAESGGRVEGDLELKQRKNTATITQPGMKKD